MQDTSAVILTLLILGIICTVYAFAIVRPLRRKDPDHGYTAGLVVGGNLLVLGAFVVSVWLMFGIDGALILGALLFIHFAIAGLPMVVEYTEHRVSQRQAERQANKDVQEIRRIVEGRDGD